MTELTHDFLDRALKLDRTERAVLAAELAASLDAEEEELGAPRDAAWLAEIERRVRRAQAGESTGADWEAVQARIEERIRRRQA